MRGKYYTPPLRGNWQGREDGDGLEYRRIHQILEPIDLYETEVNLAGAVCLLGFECDEGVRRNQGRVGASEGPNAIRNVLRNLPVHFEHRLLDLGNVVCESGDLEGAQNELSMAVEKILRAKGRPILLGGGHEVTLGHFRGIRKALPQSKRVGIINIDAHFDIRMPIEHYQTSGTSFYQIFDDSRKEGWDISCLALGIQKISNTQALFKEADKNDVRYILADKIISPYYLDLKQSISGFIESVDGVYLTIDLDVFKSSIAPGVSSPSFCGINYDYIIKDILNLITLSDKLLSIDIAELNPRYDIDQHTARLAADIIFNYLLAAK